MDQDFKNRFDEEIQDPIDSVVPPIDIVAFNEQRSCADIYRMYSQGQLDINPEFQRGEVWDSKAQSLFIDSLIKQLPIPSLCISVDASTQNRLVIDGLQRITSVIKFLNPNTTWRLSKTKDIDTRISGNTPQEIRRDNLKLLNILENVTIPITVIRCDYSKEEHMKYLFQIFHRLNSGGCKLLNQEIRNCIYGGPFNRLLINKARSKQWLDFSGVTIEKVSSSRFEHEERILRFFAFYEDYVNYKGRFASFLNSYMDKYKSANEDQIRHFSQLFDETLEIANKITEKLDSKSIIDAVLVGIAYNRDYLMDKNEEEINRIYNSLLDAPEFSSESLKEGLGATDKVKNRIKKSIEIFRRG